jgi:hypothetical protein
MLKPKSRVDKLGDTPQWRPLSDAIAWVLTRDKEFADRASREPNKCFAGGLCFHPDSGEVLELYYNDAEAAWKPLRKEIAAGRVNTKKRAYGELIKKIVDSEIEVSGILKGGNGRREKILAEEFIGISDSVDYPYQVHSRYLFSDKNYLLCGANWDGATCDGIGLSDDLYFRRELGWSDLRINSTQIFKHWPYRKESKRGRPPIYDWESEEERLRDYVARNGPFENPERLVEHLSQPERIKYRRGKKLPTTRLRETGPDRKTVLAAIERYFLPRIPNLIAQH